MADLSTTTRETLNALFKPPFLRAFGFLEGAFDIDFGDWLSDLYDMAAGTAAVAGNLLFSKETNHTITVATSTTTNANGGNLSVDAGNANGSGTDGVLNLGLNETSAVAICKSSNKIGFFGATPVVRAAAWTQTYSTASRTAANPTSNTITDSSGGTASTSAIAAITNAANAGSADVAPVANAIATLAAELALVKADLLSVKQNLNAVVDDSQAYGLLQ